MESDTSAPPVETAPAPARPPHKPTGASLVVVIASAVVFAGIVGLHAIRTDLDPFQDVMSHYANGENGAVMSVVFYAFGISAIALGVRLRLGGLERRGVARAVPVLMVLAGLSLVVAGIFEVDRPLDPETVTETIHSNTAVAAFVILVVAMGLFTAACWSDRRWRPMRWASFGLAATAAGAAAATQFTRGAQTSGGVQRVLAGAVLVWILLIALHVRRSSFDAVGAS